jgi:hypothetical protein
VITGPLVASFTQNANSLNPNPATLFDGVAKRSYGTINSNAGAPVYSVTGGLGTGNYLWCISGGTSILAKGFVGASGTCGVGAGQSTKEDTFNLTASPVSSGAAGTYLGITAEADDTGNAAVPDSFSSGQSSTTSATQVTIDPEIVIQNPFTLPNGQVEQIYNVVFSCQTAGACGGTGDPGNANAEYTWTVASGSNHITTFSTGFTSVMPVAQPGNAVFAGFAGASSGTKTATITVTDDGNPATPSCTVAGTCPPTPATNFSANILPSYAFVGSNGNNAVDVFDTSLGAGLGGAPVSTITPTGGSTPNYAAASSNGTYMFVADPGAFQLDIINAESASVTPVTGLGSSTAGDAAAVAVGPQVISASPPNSLSNPDNVFAYVANAFADDVQVIDANPADALLMPPTYGTVTGTITFSSSYSPAGASDIKVAPTFLVGAARKTHAYVLRPGGDEVCVFDAEPSSGSFQSPIPAFNGGLVNSNTDSCISLVEPPLTSPAVVPRFMDVSPDGLYAFVTEGNSTNAGYLEVIDTNPHDASTKTFETVIAEINLTSFTTNPAGVRFSPDGQTAWVAGEDVSGLLGVETALVGATQFSFLNAIPTPTPTTDDPIGIAFRPDGAFGLATLSNGSPKAVLPFTTTLVGTGFVGPWNSAPTYVPGNEVIYTDGNYYLCLVGNTNVNPPSSLGTDWQMVAAGADVATTGVTKPYGIDHIPDPVLHITTTALPTATNSVAYQSSVVAAGPNRYYTFTEATAFEVTTLAAIGLALSPDGVIAGTPPSSASGNTYSLVIQATDQSQPVNNAVLKAISLHVN